LASDKAQSSQFCSLKNFLISFQGEIQGEVLHIAAEIRGLAELLAA
jgi:hypothetical protein